MKINLNTLKVNDSFKYDDDIIFDTSYYDKRILNLKNIHLTGSIRYNAAEVLEINLNLVGIMVLADSITLEAIDYPFNIKIEEEYSLDDKYFQEYYENDQNTLDIMQILWENIVLEVPISLTRAKDVSLSGEGWALGEQEKEEIDPRLAGLSELLENGKE